MSVYVDEMVDWHKVIGRAGPRWCHLTADTDEELHAFAKSIGLQRAWFQDHHPLLHHYDIGTDRIRKLALNKGAIESTGKEAVLRSRPPTGEYT